MLRRLLPFLAALTLVSCGGGGNETDVEELLDRAFGEDMTSADLMVEGEVQLTGSPTFNRPVRIEASGPFSTNAGKLPSVDLELRIGTDGGGQTVTTGFLSTGDRAFVKFQDTYYEQPRTAVRRANESLARNRRRRGSLRSLGLNPRSWVAEARDEGEEEVAGVTTRHVSGTLAVHKMMRDLNRFVRRSGSAIGGATGERPPEPLSAEDIRQISTVVEDPSFDVYVGADDDIIRRVSGRIEFDVPEPSRASLDGIEAGTIAFSVEFADVNGDQEIEAPARARPLSALTRSLGGGGLLRGLGEAAGQGELGTSEPNITPSPATGGDGGPGKPPRHTAEPAPEAEDFREYAECLDEARPEDTDALQRCAELLERP